MSVYTPKAKISRQELLDAIEEGLDRADRRVTSVHVTSVEDARPISDKGIAKLRELGQSIDNIAFGNYIAYAGEEAESCGCPLNEAGYVDDNGAITREGLRVMSDAAATGFILGFDSHIGAKLRMTDRDNGASWLIVEDN